MLRKYDSRLRKNSAIIEEKPNILIYSEGMKVRPVLFIRYVQISGDIPPNTAADNVKDKVIARHLTLSGNKLPKI